MLQLLTLHIDTMPMKSVRVSCLFSWYSSSFSCFCNYRKVSLQSNHNNQYNHNYSLLFDVVDVFLLACHLFFLVAS